MTMRIKFEIECGGRQVIEAESPQDAWRAFKRATKTPLADLARFRELPWNGKYSWDNKQGGRKRRGAWYFCHPCWFGENAPEK